MLGLLLEPGVERQVERRARLAEAPAELAHREAAAVDDDDSLAAVVKRAEETARLAPEDPEAMPLLGPQEYVAVPDAAAGELGLGELAAGVKLCIERAMAGKAIAAGFADSSAAVACIANSKGLFGYQRRTSASVALRQVCSLLPA